MKKPTGKDGTPTAITDDESSAMVCSSCGAKLRISRSAGSEERMAMLTQHRKVCPNRNYNR